LQNEGLKGRYEVLGNDDMALVWWRHLAEKGSHTTRIKFQNFERRIFAW